MIGTDRKIHSATRLPPRIRQTFHCEKCRYMTDRKSQYTRHLATAKHLRECESEGDLKNEGETRYYPPSTTEPTIFTPPYVCRCGKKYKYDSGYYRHKLRCELLSVDEAHNHDKDNKITAQLIMDILKDNNEMKQLITEQNQLLMGQNQTIQDLIKNGTYQMNNSMNNNKTFNLQFFLHETCKNAMNLTEFIDSIQLQLNDLERFGEVGYIEGVSSIITNNLKALDITKRPLHCTDKKREIIYIKDQNQWEKGDACQTKLRNAIQRVENENLKLMSEFKRKNPDYGDARSSISDKYNKMVVEALGGTGNNREEKFHKIIQNISKTVTIDKYV